MSNTKLIVIYDLEGTIITQYSSTQEIVPPVGVPYIIVDDYEPNYEGDDYRPVERVDVSVEPNELVYGPSKKEQEIASMTLDEYKESRQRENKVALAKFLEENPLTWIDGLQYGVTQEDQSEMIADKAAYDLKHAIDPNWPLQWHSTKSDCRDFTEEEFLGLMNAIIDFVYPYRQLEMKYKDAIYSAENKDEVGSVGIVYALPTQEDADQEDTNEEETPQEPVTEEPVEEPTVEESTEGEDQIPTEEA